MLFEYSQFDGSQHFAPLSAEWRSTSCPSTCSSMATTCCGNWRTSDKREADLLKLLIKEGYLEKDEEGRLRVGPKG